MPAKSNTKLERVDAYMEKLVVSDDGYVVRFDGSIANMIGTEKPLCKKMADALADEYGFNEDTDPSQLESLDEIQGFMRFIMVRAGCTIGHRGGKVKQDGNACKYPRSMMLFFKTDWYDTLDDVTARRRHWAEVVARKEAEKEAKRRKWRNG
eukprot:3183177-Prymnesium_polylepis.1